MKKSENSSLVGFPPRSAFTMIEMLVVVAIIGVLAALAAGATMQVISNQRKSNTEETITKVAGALDKLWKAEVARAKEEPIPYEILNGNPDLNGTPDPTKPRQWGLIRMASPDPNNPQPNDLLVMRRARVIWIALRLKQRFPMNFAEAVSPTPAQVQLSGVPYLQMPADPVFSRALSGQTIMPSLPPHDYESSVCLLLALSQGRGAGFSQERLSSGELADFNGLKTIVDAWGRPLTFYRWPMGGEIAASNPYIESTATQIVIRNPLDPDAVLMQPDRSPTQPGWNTAIRNSSRFGVWAFEKLFHKVHGLAPNGSYRPESYYTVPVVASAGPNVGARTGAYLTVYEMMGLPPPPDEFPPPAGLPVALRHDPMEMVTGAQKDSFDNIYSFRLRLGARGD
jgi:prepilin-type N-terminal cleavage/methylation domain-containing protein